MEPFTVRHIHQALMEHHHGRNGGVYCEVASPYAQPFTYAVYQARTHYGVLEVNTCSGWKCPLRVFIRPLVETEKPQ